MEVWREMGDMDVLLQQLQQPEQQAGEGYQQAEHGQEVWNNQQCHASPPHRNCPRCGSMNTRFCYFNNYSSSQPRYFCRACKRYWTHGGSLRDLPVGGCSSTTIEMEVWGKMGDMDVLLQQPEQQAEHVQEVWSNQQCHASPPHRNCPRCGSMNTKFCYFNNYSSSQPRYFCRACNRYWTHGGSLRDLPVGGSGRKSRRSHKCTPSHANYSSKLLSESPAKAIVSSPSSSTNLGSKETDNPGAPAVESVNLSHSGEGFDFALLQEYNLPSYDLPEQQQQIQLPQSSLMSGLVNFNNPIFPAEQSGISTRIPFTTPYLHQSFNNGGDVMSPSAVLPRADNNNNASAAAPSEPYFWSDFPNY